MVPIISGNPQLGIQFMAFRNSRYPYKDTPSKEDPRGVPILMHPKDPEYLRGGY